VKAGRNLMRKGLKDANGGKLERGKENAGQLPVAAGPAWCSSRRRAVLVFQTLPGRLGVLPEGAARP
ncbi:hypothetical protein ABZV86_32560, partial [Streptomyces microflavus]